MEAGRVGVAGLLQKTAPVDPRKQIPLTVLVSTLPTRGPPSTSNPMRPNVFPKRAPKEKFLIPVAVLLNGAVPPGGGTPPNFATGVV